MNGDDADSIEHNMDSRQRFLREGQTADAINHPNAVYIYGTEEIGGVPVISMELVPGGTLEEKVKERGPLMRGVADRLAGTWLVPE